MKANLSDLYSQNPRKACQLALRRTRNVIQIRPDWSGGRSRFIVSTMGDFVERNEKRLGLV